MRFGELLEFGDEDGNTRAEIEPHVLALRGLEAVYYSTGVYALVSITGAVTDDWGLRLQCGLLRRIKHLPPDFPERCLRPAWNCGAAWSVARWREDGILRGEYPGGWGLFSNPERIERLKQLLTLPAVSYNQTRRLLCELEGIHEGYLPPFEPDLYWFPKMDGGVTERN